MVAAAFTLTNCTQEIDAPVEPSFDGVPFEIVAKSAGTKTVNNGLETVWADGDALNLFHAEAEGTEYVNDGEFKLDGENTFKGKLAGTLKETYCYDWYAIYPYSSYITTPANTGSGYSYFGSRSDKAQTQNGINSMAHIAGSNYPLYGVCKDWEHYAGEPVEIEMTHLTCLLEVNVTNNTAEDLLVSEVSFTAPENIVGTFYVNFAGDTPSFTDANYVSKVANLDVQNATALANGASAKFYLAVKPFTAAANSEIALSVNGYSKKVTLPAETAFNAGEIKTLKFNYNKTVAAGEYTIDWASANDWVESSTKYISGYYTIKTDKNEGSTEPMVSSDNDCRVYAKGNLTISHSAGVNIQKLVFNISEHGKKRFCDITASIGNVTIDKENYKVIWEGSASSVTFTVGETAVYGTESTKAGQLCFDSIDVLAEPTDAPYVPVLKKIELSEMTTEYLLGDTFEFDGVVTAYYYNQEPKAVNPTSVSQPEMTEGNHSVSVSYTEDGVTATASYNIYVEDPNAEESEVATVTVDLTAQGYANATAVSSVTSGDVTVNFDKGTNSNNPPKYYANGTAVRVYAGNYFTVSAGSNVTKVVLTYGSSDGTNGITVDVGNFNTNTWEGKAESVKFTISGTTGNRRLAKIEVTYEK